jgi:hypothetical protein
MKNIILISILLSSTFVSANLKTTSKDTKYHKTVSSNNTEYYEKFSSGIYEFISTGDFSKVKEMFGDSGVYGGDCIVDSCSMYDIQLTSDELEERLSQLLTEKSYDLTLTRNEHPCYTYKTFTHGTFFKFEISYNETGRVDDFLVYVDYNGKLLSVLTNTFINIKGYFDSRTKEFHGNKNI